MQYQIFDAWTKGRSLIDGCFISYSAIDAKFVDKLRERLLAEGINVWLDRHDMVAGTIQDQVWRAIQFHHVVIIVLSRDSVKSDWVEHELEMARKRRRSKDVPSCARSPWTTHGRQRSEPKMVPGDPSRQLWRTLKRKLVVDFAPWKTKAFEKSFETLVRGLKTNYGPR